MTWSLFVPGEPKSTQTGSIVRVGTRRFPGRMNTGWSNRIALAANLAPPPEPMTGPLRAIFRFRMVKPTSGKAAKRAYPTVRPDLENCCKGLLDALQGIVFADDSAVVELLLTKVYDGAPGVEITVAPVGASRRAGEVERLRAALERFERVKVHASECHDCAVDEWCHVGIDLYADAMGGLDAALAGAEPEEG